VIGKAILPFLLAGYNVLAIDLRNHGNSQDAKPISLGLHEVPRRHTTHDQRHDTTRHTALTYNYVFAARRALATNQYQSEDVLAAVDWLRANADELGVDPERVGLWGESMGAATSLLACQKDRHERRIKAVVSDSSYLNARGAVTFRYSTTTTHAYRECGRRLRWWCAMVVGGRMNVFGVPALLQEVYWWWMHRLTPWDITEIDVERAIQQIAVPVLVRWCSATTPSSTPPSSGNALLQHSFPQITHGNRDRVVDFNDGVRYVDECKYVEAADVAVANNVAVVCAT
jgi:acetyl esterase/lipase